MDNTFWSQLITNIALAFLPVLASLAAAYLVAQFKLLWAKAKAQQPDLVDTLEWAARTAVSAAEQAGAAGIIKDKKAYALQVAQQWLDMKGLTVDLTAIDAAIEAAVYQEINKDNPSPSLKVTGFLPEK